MIGVLWVNGLAFSQEATELTTQESTSPPAEVQEEGQKSESLPQIGFVVSSNGVVVRDGYPKVNVQGGYQLGEKICAIGKGVGFKVLKTQTLLNKEVWYKIESLGDIKSTSVDCGASTMGWIVGRLNDGKRLVELATVTQDNLAQVQATTTPQAVQSELVPESQPAEAGKVMAPLPEPTKPDENKLPEDKGTGSLLLWWNYVAIALGTVTGNLFMDLDGGRISNRNYWRDATNLFRLLMLVGFNLILLNVACSNFTLLSIGILKSLPTLIKSFWGTYIAGIVIVVLILKAIASSESIDSSGD